MSTLYVDTITEKTAGNGVQIPGHVVQVVQYFDKGSLTAKNPLGQLSTVGLTDIMSKTITTKNANSKILVQLSTNAFNGTNVLRGQIVVLRDATEIDADQYGFYGPSSLMQPYSSAVLDTPNVVAGTTLTYKLRVSNTTGGTLVVGYGDSGGGSGSHITLMEIAQ